MSYSKTHPLWNRDDTWIATRASIAVTRAENVPHGADQVMIGAVGLAAIVHMARADVARADRAEADLKETRYGRACVCGRWVRGLGYQGTEHE